jgi:hypothetical protein
VLEHGSTSPCGPAGRGIISGVCGRAIIGNDGEGE